MLCAVSIQDILNYLQNFGARARLKRTFAAQIIGVNSQVLSPSAWRLEGVAQEFVDEVCVGLEPFRKIGVFRIVTFYIKYKTSNCKGI